MNVIIIGFMGAGKSVVGNRLAKHLNMKFVDMDKEIERRENSTITKIFEIGGEKYFRELEKKLFSELIKEDDIIISTGGGIVTEIENCKILKEQKYVVFLDADVHTIIKHISHEKQKRPLLKDSNDLEQSIKKLMDLRYKSYIESSNIRIDVNSKNISEVVSQILVYIR